MLRETYAGRRVLVTGHTGFKGAWLTAWLRDLGADIRGYALPPPTEPSLFAALAQEQVLGTGHQVGDVREAADLRAAVDRAAPEIVFHLAAQPLVRRSYAEPRETFATNVMGTLDVLEAVRAHGRRCAVVVVTSDKCYEPARSARPFAEDDPLGGHDPYSASKAAAEIVTQAYARSYFGPDAPVAVASARAGNVIGGGDWAEDRLLPDCIRSLQAGEAIRLRYPAAVRPWQHVLEPVSGYLLLGARLWRGLAQPETRLPHTAYNFGPAEESQRSVQDLVEETLKHWPGRWECPVAATLHESAVLRLAVDRARVDLGWRPVWSFAEAVARSARWYRDYLADPSVHTAGRLVAEDLAAYGAAARTGGADWL